MLRNRKINVILLFDEMKVKEDLVFDKHTCELIAFADLGEINNILDRLEHHCGTDKNDSPFTENDVATHMLQFMVRRIFTKLEFPLDTYIHVSQQQCTSTAICSYIAVSFEVIR